MTTPNKDPSDGRLHLVANPEGPDYRFTGDCLVDQQSASGGRIKVFKSDSGFYVLEQIRSAYRGRESLYRVLVAEDLDQLAEALTDTQGGKAAMAALGRPCIVDL